MNIFKLSPIALLLFSGAAISSYNNLNIDDRLNPIFNVGRYDLNCTSDNPNQVSTFKNYPFLLTNRYDFVGAQPFLPTSDSRTFYTCKGNVESNAFETNFEAKVVSKNLKTRSLSHLANYGFGSFFNMQNQSLRYDASFNATIIPDFNGISIDHNNTDSQLLKLFLFSVNENNKPEIIPFYSTILKYNNSENYIKSVSTSIKAVNKNANLQDNEKDQIINQEIPFELLKNRHYSVLNEKGDLVGYATIKNNIITAYSLKNFFSQNESHQDSSSSKSLFANMNIITPSVISTNNKFMSTGQWVFKENNGSPVLSQLPIEHDSLDNSSVITLNAYKYTKTNENINLHSYGDVQILEQKKSIKSCSKFSCFTKFEIKIKNNGGFGILSYGQNNNLTIINPNKYKDVKNQNLLNLVYIFENKKDAFTGFKEKNVNNQDNYNLGLKSSSNTVYTFGENYNGNVFASSSNINAFSGRVTGRITIPPSVSHNKSLISTKNDINIFANGYWPFYPFEKNTYDEWDMQSWYVALPSLSDGFTLIHPSSVSVKMTNEGYSYTININKNELSKIGTLSKHGLIIINDRGNANIAGTITLKSSNNESYSFSVNVLSQNEITNNFGNKFNIPEAVFTKQRGKIKAGEFSYSIIDNKLVQSNNLDKNSYQITIQNLYPEAMIPNILATGDAQIENDYNCQFEVKPFQSCSFFISSEGESGEIKINDQTIKINPTRLSSRIAIPSEIPSTKPLNLTIAIDVDQQTGDEIVLPPFDESDAPIVPPKPVPPKPVPPKPIVPSDTKVFNRSDLADTKGGSVSPLGLIALFALGIWKRKIKKQ